MSYVSGSAESESYRDKIQSLHQEIDVMRQQLALQEVQQHRMLNQLPQIVWLADALGRMSYFNHQWVDTTGKSATSSLGSEFLMAVHADDRSTFLTHWQDAINTKSTFSSNLRLRLADGSYRWFIARATPVQNAMTQRLEWVGTFTDIHEAEDALRESDRRFRAIFDQTFQFTGLMQPDGTLIEANKTALDFGGVTPAEVIGKPLWETYWWSHSSEAQEHLRGAIAQAAQGEFIRDEIEVLGADGKLATIDFSIKPIYDDTQAVVLLIPEGRDITQRKRAEAELQTLNLELEQRIAARTAELERVNQDKERLLQQERQARQQVEQAKSDIQLYADIVENMQLGLYVWQLNDVSRADSLTLKLFNPAAQQLAARDLTPLVGQTITQIFPNIPDYDLEAFATIALTGIPQTQQVTHYEDERVGLQYYSYKAFPLPDQCVGVAFENITYRILSERQLQESERRYATLAQISPVGIFRANPSGQCIYVNDRWCQIVGLTREQALVEGWLAGVHPADGDRISAEWQRTLVEQQPFRVEYRVLHPSGKLVWVLAQAVADQDAVGVINGFVGTLTDITEERATELALLESEERFRTTFEQAAVGIAHVAMNGRWLRVNQRLCEILGYTREELYQRTFQDVTHPEDLKTDLDHIDRLLKGEIRDFSYEKRYIHKSGAIIWVEITVSLGRDTGNLHRLAPLPAIETSDADAASAQYFIGVVEEISERKAAELALQERASELSYLNTVLSRTTSLLKRRNEELDQFAYIASHDLKAPLRAIANLSEWIEDDIGDQLPAENRHQMDLLRCRVQRMERLISGLLDYSRVGRVQVNTEWVNVSELLSDIIDSLAPPPTFTIIVEEGMPTFSTKRLALWQVFANLIGNAVKHHHRSDGWVRVSMREMSNHYEFSVADNGPGIESHHHDRIFQIFQTLRPDSAQSDDMNASTGIGLSIVKKIVESEGGTIQVTSQMGEGAIFRFTWPKQIRVMIDEG